MRLYNKKQPEPPMQIGVCLTKRVEMPSSDHDIFKGTVKSI